MKNKSLPNKATLRAIKQVEQNKTHKAKDLKSLFEQLGIGGLPSSKKSIRLSKSIQKKMIEGYKAEAEEGRAICKEWESTLADGLDEDPETSEFKD